MPIPPEKQLVRTSLLRDMVEIIKEAAERDDLNWRPRTWAKMVLVKREIEREIKL